MARFRKKPVIVEAFQITEDTIKDKENWPGWLKAAWQKEPKEVGSFYEAVYFVANSSKLVVHTLEGDHYVTLGDYIIQGIQGEIYPCKPDIFEATYESV